MPSFFPSFSSLRPSDACTPVFIFSVSSNLNSRFQTTSLKNHDLKQRQERPQTFIAYRAARFYTHLEITVVPWRPMMTTRNIGWREFQLLNSSGAKRVCLKYVPDLLRWLLPVPLRTPSWADAHAGRPCINVGGPISYGPDAQRIEKC